MARHSIKHRRAPATKPSGITIAGLALSRPMVLLVILLVSLIVRIVYLFEYSHSYYWDLLTLDTHTHDLLGRQIAQGDFIGDHAFFRAPLYPYLLGAIYWTFGHDLFLPRIINFFFGSLSCLLIYLIGERVSRPSVGFLAALAACFYWVFIYFEGELLLVAVYILLILLFFYLLLTSEGHEKRRLALAGFVLGLAAITRPNVIVFFPFVLIWLARTCADWRRQLLSRALVAFLPAVLVISAVTLRNYITAQDIVLVSYQGGINFYIGNNPVATGHSSVAPLPAEQIPNDYRQKHADNIWSNDDVWLSSHYLAEAETGRDLKASEIERFWYGKGLEYALNNPPAFLKLLLRKAYYFMNAYEIPSNKDLHRFIREHSFLLRSLSIIDFGTILSLGLLGFIVARGRMRSLFLLASFVSVYALTNIAFFVNTRFRLPIVPFLLLSSSFFALWLIAQLKTRRFAISGIALVLCAGLVLFTHTTSFGLKNSWQTSVLYYNQGNALARRGMLEASIREYREAIRIEPDHVRPYDTICWCHNRRGEYDQTMLWGKRGIVRFPDHARLHSHLAMACLATGREDQGIAELESVLSIEPENTAASVNLGLIHYKRGALEKAARRFTANLEIPGAGSEFYLLSHIHVGLIGLEAGRWSEALEAFRCAMETDSLGFNNCFRLASAHSRLKDHASCEAALQGLLSSCGDRDRASVDRIVSCLREAINLPPQPNRPGPPPGS